MENLAFNGFFSEEDKAFNREMISRSLNQERVRGNSERRGGKMPMNNLLENKMFPNRQYDFTSKILSEYRRKWSITE